MKKVVDKLLSDLVAATGFKYKGITVFCKDGFCYEVDITNGKIETDETCIALVGNVIETTDKKGSKKVKRDAVVSWSEISRIEFDRETTLN